ncbi:hypothetical protein LEP1GSC035_3019 [Leptospira noguchii str. 2007001578]|uniref:Uncharacterized protein n=1 Tax=Leptospira noguchii str. 2007001578 TaxID=1049974 RepID=A0ABP2TBV1_9LEPT|nr:hypothetical protein LEP1GSC035_3019 [Leptospira noguchii str. 2007001578]
MKKSGKPGTEAGSDHAHQTKAWRTKVLSSSENISNRLSKQIQIL